MFCMGIHVIISFDTRRTFTQCKKDNHLYINTHTWNFKKYASSNSFCNINDHANACHTKKHKPLKRFWKTFLSYLETRLTHSSSTRFAMQPHPQYHPTYFGVTHICDHWTRSMGPSGTNGIAQYNYCYEYSIMALRVKIEQLRSL